MEPASTQSLESQPSTGNGQPNSTQAVTHTDIDEKLSKVDLGDNVSNSPTNLDEGSEV